MTKTPAPQTAPQAAPPDAGAEMIVANIARRKDPNSEAARFDKALEKQQESEQKEKASKEEMLGADLPPFTRRRDTDDSAIEFFPRPPKLGALPQLLYEVSTASQDAQSQIELVFVIASTFLYVHDAELGHRRRATVAEITQCMNFADLEMLQGMSQRFTGIAMDHLSPAKK